MNLSEILAPELEKLNQLIYSHYQSTDIPLIKEVVQHLINAGGKRIRPLLIFAFCKMFNNNNIKSVNAAASIELIHTATLLHDDVIDGATMRRDIPTANNLWGNKISILVGDYLFTIASKCAIACDDQRVLDIVTDAISVITQGEIQQLLNISNLQLTYEEYLQVISAKTAKLFAAAGHIAATLNGIPDQSLLDFGQAFGMAFQIVDDVIDYQENSGKRIGQDFYDGKVTLPVIIAYQQANDNEKIFWQRCFQEQDIHPGDLNQAIEYLQRYNAIEQALEVAANYTDKCYKVMNDLPSSQTNSALYKMVKDMLVRSR